MSQVIKNRKLAGVLLVSSFIGLGMSMPGCPGQQAMQQQLDALAKNSDASGHKLQTLESNARGTNTDISQMKQLIIQMTNAVQAQKGAIDQLSSGLKDLQARVAGLEVKGGKKRKR